MIQSKNHWKLIIASALSKWAAAQPGAVLPPEALDPLALHELLLVENPP